MQYFKQFFHWLQARRTGLSSNARIQKNDSDWMPRLWLATNTDVDTERTLIIEVLQRMQATNHPGRY